MKPSRLLLALVALLAFVGLFDVALGLLLVLIATVVGFSIADLVVSDRGRTIRVDRVVQSSFAIGRRATVELHLQHDARFGIKVAVRDLCPHLLVPAPRRVEVTLPADSRVTVRYEIQPRARGRFEIDGVVLIVRSLFGLWQIKRTMNIQSEVRVYPDFRSIAKYIEFATDARTTQLGIKLISRRGSGLEFHQLREYREGDSPNQIHWKATAKRRSLISKEFQEEINQNIVFLLDSGRRMRTKDGEISHFDSALNAMMLVAYVALRQGDAVGTLCFGKSQRWIAPVSGAPAINSLLNSTYDLDCGPVTSDLVSASEEILQRQKRRSLVVILTSLRDEDSDILLGLRLLRPKHVVVLVNLRETVLDELTQREVVDLNDALEIAEGANYLKQSGTLQKRCARECHAVLDAVPERLMVELVNSYWQVKKSGVL